MKRTNIQNDWAGQVPSRTHHRPYRDYGWERQQSVLPEFRDPALHFTPDEYEELEPWQQGYERQIMYPDDLLVRDRLNHLGPHIGKGPRSYQRSDERLYEDICDRMTGHGQLDASDIEVEVSNAEVTLRGTAADRRAKRLAENIVDTVYGVRDVHNLLHLRQGSPTQWTDEAGGSGVYPASEADKAPAVSEAHGMASWGQGERDAKGYNDHGDSEIHPGRRKAES